MRHRMLALILALTVASWAQTATQTTPSTPQQSTPTQKAKCPCCDKMAADKGDAKDAHGCCQSMKAGDGKDMPSCCQGKDAKSCMKDDKMASACKDCCAKDKAAACCNHTNGKQCGKSCCTSKSEKTA